MHFHGHSHSNQESQALGFCRKGVIEADLVWTLLCKTRCWVEWEASSERDLAWLSEALTAKGD